VKKPVNIHGVVPTPPHFVDLMVNLIFENKTFWDSQISSELFILDSSVGDGRFLFEFVKSWLNLSDQDYGITLHGLDINQKSIESCKTHQKQFSAVSSINLSFKTGNALIGDHKCMEEDTEGALVPIPGVPFHWYKEWPLHKRTKGYDICLGNPTFGLRFTQEEKKYFKHQYLSVDPEVESYLLFVERSIELLKEKGLLVLLIPNNFATNYRYQKFRNFIFSNMSIQKIIMLKDKVFPEVAVETCILMGYKDTRPVEEKQHNIEFSEYSRSEGFSKIQKSCQDELWNEDHRFLVPLKSSEYKKILETIARDSTPLGEMVNIARGIELGFHSELTSDKEMSSAVPLVAGRNIHKFFIDEKIRYIKFDKDQKRIYKDINLYKQPKILLRRIGNRLTAAYDPNNLFCVCDVYILSLRPKWNHLSLRYLELILNSSLLTFYLNQRFLTVKKLFPKIPINYLRQLPIKTLQETRNRDIMDNYLEGLDKLNYQERKRKMIEEMDHFIYETYNLTASQIKTITEYIGKDS